MDFPILRYLDVLIGFSLIMILACTAVAAITQVILASTFMRARNLRKGLADLITELDPDVLRADAEYIAERLQRHPLAGRAKWIGSRLLWWVRNQWRAMRGRLPLPCVTPATTLHREEVALFLLEWASGSGAFNEQDGQLQSGKTDADPLAALRTALASAASRNGIDDAERILAIVRARIVANERDHPGDPAQLWRTQALATAAQSDFLARIFTWYDHAVARITDRFTVSAKLVTAAVALALCIFTQLDSIAIVKRLSQDEKYRASMLAQAQTYWARQQSLQAEAQTASGPEKRADENLAAQLREMHDRILQEIAPVEAAAGVTLSAPWKDVSAFAADMRQRPGILLSWILITLGAPFWYDLLKNVLGLRSLLARKDDAERDARQGAEPASPDRARAAAGGA